jgi:biotin carboxyl carrier protein
LRLFVEQLFIHKVILRSKNIFIDKENKKMVTAIKMPKMGLSGDTSLIGEWIKKKGDKVSVGESILTVETDKATFEVEAEVEGVLGRRGTAGGFL